MQSKYLPGGSGSICRLIDLAFREAEEGDREAALAAWNQAIAEGYVVSRKAEKNLMHKIRVNSTPAAQA